MDDWTNIPAFGTRPEFGTPVIRPSAYGLIRDEHGRLAVVRTGRGTFLPGGGIESGETPEEAIRREALEECGLIVRLGIWEVRAVELVYSEPDETHYEKRSTFIAGAVAGFDSARLEADHELVWVDSEVATQMLLHESHRWAVERWMRQAGRLW